MGAIACASPRLVRLEPAFHLFKPLVDPLFQPVGIGCAFFGGHLFDDLDENAVSGLAAGFEPLCKTGEVRVQRRRVKGLCADQVQRRLRLAP